MSDSEFPGVAVEIWFNHSYEFFAAMTKLIEHEILEENDSTSYLLLKEMDTDRMGFGFYDREQGIMAKLVI